MTETRDPVGGESPARPIGSRSARRRLVLVLALLLLPWARQAVYAECSAHAPSAAPWIGLGFYWASLCVLGWTSGEPNARSVVWWSGMVTANWECVVFVGREIMRWPGLHKTFDPFDAPMLWAKVCVIEWILAATAFAAGAYGRSVVRRVRSRS